MEGSVSRLVAGCQCLWGVAGGGSQVGRVTAAVGSAVAVNDDFVKEALGMPGSSASCKVRWKAEGL